MLQLETGVVICLQVHFNFFSEFVDFEEEIFLIILIVSNVSVNTLVGLDRYRVQYVVLSDDFCFCDLSCVIPSEEVVEVHLGHYSDLKLASLVTVIILDIMVTGDILVTLGGQDGLVQTAGTQQLVLSVVFFG